LGSLSISFLEIYPFPYSCTPKSAAEDTNNDQKEEDKQLLTLLLYPMLSLRSFPIATLDIILSFNSYNWEVLFAMFVLQL
jgi:hypothetical protein